MTPLLPPRPKVYSVDDTLAEGVTAEETFGAKNGAKKELTEVLCVGTIVEFVGVLELDGPEVDMGVQGAVQQATLPRPHLARTPSPPHPYPPTSPHP